MCQRGIFEKTHSKRYSCIYLTKTVCLMKVLKEICLFERGKESQQRHLTFFTPWLQQPQHRLLSPYTIPILTNSHQGRGINLSGNIQLLVPPTKQCKANPKLEWQSLRCLLIHFHLFIVIQCMTQWEGESRAHALEVLHNLNCVPFFFSQEPNFPLDHSHLRLLQFRCTYRSEETL